MEQSCQKKKVHMVVQSQLYSVDSNTANERNVFYRSMNPSFRIKRSEPERDDRFFSSFLSFLLFFCGCCSSSFGVCFIVPF